MTIRTDAWQDGPACWACLAAVHAWLSSTDDARARDTRSEAFMTLWPLLHAVEGTVGETVVVQE